MLAPRRVHRRADQPGARLVLAGVEDQEVHSGLGSGLGEPFPLR
jgi:hypothetical protein